MFLLKKPLRFQWNQGNLDKNLKKHQITNEEAEEAFFGLPLLIVPDQKHSSREPRYLLLGKTNSQKLLTIIFTIRLHQIRIISARPMSKKEKALYVKNK